MNKILSFSLFLFMFTTSVFGAGFLDKKAVRIDKAVPDFKLLDTTGLKHQLSQYRGRPVMIHFWSATCPFVMRYDEELKQIAADYTPKGVIVLAIDSNSDETIDQIKNVAAKRKINYPILIDSGNKIADQFGAITTPHVFIIDRDGALAYEGAVDDQGWSEVNPINNHYAREALDALLSGKSIPHPQTRSVGCTVKRAF